MTSRNTGSRRYKTALRKLYILLKLSPSLLPSSRYPSIHPSSLLLPSLFPLTSLFSFSPFYTLLSLIVLATSRLPSLPPLFSPTSLSPLYSPSSLPFLLPALSPHPCSQHEVISLTANTAHYTRRYSHSSLNYTLHARKLGGNQLLQTISRNGPSLSY